MEKFPKPIKKEAKRIRPRPEDIEMWGPTKPMTAEEVRKEMEKTGQRPATLEDLGASKRLIETLKKGGTVIVGREKREKGKRLPEKEEPKQLPYQREK